MNKENNFDCIIWSDQYGMLNAELDEDHKGFIDMCNELNDLVERNALTEKELAKVLYDLLNHADQHFAREEKEMQKNGYPSYLAHCKEHEKFRQSIMALSSEFEEVGIRMGERLALFVKSWFIKHLATSDKDYADFVEKKQNLKDHLEDNMNTP